MKKISILLTCALCAAIAMGNAAAQEPQEGTAVATVYKIRTMERLRSLENWLSTDNPSGLVRNNYDMTDVLASYSFEKGDFRDLGVGNYSNRYNVASESYKRLNRFSFHGKLGFTYDAERDRTWGSKFYPWKTSMLVGDEHAGSVRGDTYDFLAGVAYSVSPKFSVGVLFDYVGKEAAKRRDPRSLSTNMYMKLRPGVSFDSKYIAAGINFNYERMTEQIKYENFGTNESLPIVYLFEGLWFYSTGVVGTGNSEFHPVFYKGSTMGGAAQLEFKLGSVRLMNEFAGDYTETRRYRREADQELGDEEILTYRYTATLSHSSSCLDGRLRVRMSWSELMKYNNIQRLDYVSPGNSSNQAFVQYGKVLKFTQNTDTYGGDYTLYINRRRLDPSWTVSVRADYCISESNYNIKPAEFVQNMEFWDAGLDVTKNILLNRGWLDINLGAGYGGGSGDALIENVPDNMEIFNFREDLLHRNFDYLTSKRMSYGGWVQYTHKASDRIAVLLKLSAANQQATEGTFKDKSRSVFMATLGMKF